MQTNAGSRTAATIVIEDARMGIFQAYLITLGWAIVGSIGMGVGIAIALKLFDFTTPKVDEWEEIKKGNIAMAIVLAAIIALGVVVSAAVHP